jgi:predicted nucleotidyltransferase
MKSIILDHDIILLNNGYFIDTLGYFHDDNILALITYSPDAKGEKIINGQRYRKRFLNNEEPENYKFKNIIKSTFPQFNPIFRLYYWAVKVPYYMVSNIYNPSQTFERMKFNHRLSSVVEVIDLYLSEFGPFGITGSALVGCENINDLDIFVYGPEMLNRIIMARNEILKIKEFNIDTETATEKYIKAKASFFRYFDKKTIEYMAFNKKRFRYNILGINVSFWVRYNISNNLPLLKNYEILKKHIFYNLTISNDFHSHFCPIVYETDENILLASYARFFRGALLPGNKVEGSGKLVYIETPSGYREAIFVDFDDYFRVII